MADTGTAGTVDKRNGVLLGSCTVTVIGGVCKGVGRLLIKAMGEVAHLAAGAERAARLAEAAKDIVAFLNRVGAAEAGAKEVHRTDELILLEGKAAKRTARGGWAQNSPKPKDIERVYKHEPGFPNLRDKVDNFDDGKVLYPDVATLFWPDC